jgi:hypothetical protein
MGERARGWIGRRGARLGLAVRDRGHGLDGAAGNGDQDPPARSEEFGRGPQPSLLDEHPFLVALRKCRWGWRPGEPDLADMDYIW